MVADPRPPLLGVPAAPVTSGLWHLQYYWVYWFVSAFPPDSAPRGRRCVRDAVQFSWRVGRIGAPGILRRRRQSPVLMGRGGSQKAEHSQRCHWAPPTPSLVGPVGLPPECRAQWPRPPGWGSQGLSPPKP